MKESPWSNIHQVNNYTPATEWWGLDTHNGHCSCAETNADTKHFSKEGKKPLHWNLWMPQKTFPGNVKRTRPQTNSAVLFLMCALFANQCRCISKAYWVPINMLALLVLSVSMFAAFHCWCISEAFNFIIDCHKLQGIEKEDLRLRVVLYHCCVVVWGKPPGLPKPKTRIWIHWVGRPDGLTTPMRQALKFQMLVWRLESDSPLWNRRFVFGTKTKKTGCDASSQNEFWIPRILILESPSGQPNLRVTRSLHLILLAKGMMSCLIRNIVDVIVNTVRASTTMKS